MASESDQETIYINSRSLCNKYVIIARLRLFMIFVTCIPVYTYHQVDFSNLAELNVWDVEGTLVKTMFSIYK